ncbi:response regulator [Oleisolibacter albus]|uniref:response regulator n=1 Tax=Oleisolibacter albus TaxID=2171757 RepID=UPI00138FF9A9|nr:response regulator [Oleisolibacter albus]
MTVSAPPLRLIICEDEAIIAMGLQMMVTAFGHEVCAVCASAEEAVAAAEQHRPDLVLMDVMLRGPGDGIEAACAIRSRFGIPSLIMTAIDGPQVRERMAAARPYGFLSKPYRPDILRRCLEQLPAD